MSTERFLAALSVILSARYGVKITAKEGCACISA